MQDPIHLSDLNDKLVPQTSMGRYHHYVPINYSNISPISSYISFITIFSITFPIGRYTQVGALDSQSV